ncbi:MAG: sensor histidine kinase, partial [Rhodobacteraceae bacterium]|nr:sensor histidine kinase [Paracoccaceae bacterium]
TLGPMGVQWLRPNNFLGMAGTDPLLTAMVLSLGLNTVVFIVVSLASFPSPLERLQGAQFVKVFDYTHAPSGWQAAQGTADDLLIMARRILGAGRAARLFGQAARAQGRDSELPDPTPDFLERLERELAGSVGAATAHAMVGQITGGAGVSVQDLLAVADETAQIMEYSSKLEAQSVELARTAARLREVNQKLTELSVQKDAFLSQISHELRTPMTSIRAFSEILMQSDGLDEAARARFSKIIHDESRRLTRLLDDLLDLCVLENGHVSLNPSEVHLARVLERALNATAALEESHRLEIIYNGTEEAGLRLNTDADRLAQVFINLISNAQKYCEAEAPSLTITLRERARHLEVEFADNGAGIPERQRSLIFEKFVRLDGTRPAQGAGLGLAISREIMQRLGGGLHYVPSQGGAVFLVRLPKVEARAA